MHAVLVHRMKTTQMLRARVVHRAKYSCMDEKLPQLTQASLQFLLVMCVGVNIARRQLPADADDVRGAAQNIFRVLPGTQQMLMTPGRCASEDPPPWPA